jgi:hypothetical protein
VKNQERLDQIDEMLRDSAPVRPAPAGLRAGVMSAIFEERSAPRRAPVFSRAALAAAAAIAVAGGVLLMRPAAAPIAAPLVPPNTVAAAPQLDPTPALLPAVRFVATSLDEPIARETESVLEDTRRAADFVVSCLPFTRGG